MNIRRAREADWPAIWAIFQEVIATGDTFAYAPDTDEETARRGWFEPPTLAYVAEENDHILGSFMLRPNQPGLGAHIANAGFIVSSSVRGRGIGRQMGEYALKEALRQGYLAMQFNFVVSTNERAVTLWQSLGFAVIATVPRAFRHAQEGFVDVYIMHRTL